MSREAVRSSNAAPPGARLGRFKTDCRILVGLVDLLTFGVSAVFKEMVLRAPWSVKTVGVVSAPGLLQADFCSLPSKATLVSHELSGETISADIGPAYLLPQCDWKK